ncbi:hypothetical protein E2542_SST10561 [Spatholobus suberectus]|nr:hypothetical protein E2542_SST10561 [Spatholobus suberectus]
MNRVVNCRHYRLVVCWVEWPPASAGAPFVSHHSASIAEILTAAATTVNCFAGERFGGGGGCCTTPIFRLGLAESFHLIEYKVLGLLGFKVTNEGLDPAGHAIGTAWAAFKLWKALNPKSVIKPTTLAKAAAEANSAKLKARK